jgi:hypothetical protein
MTTFHAAECTVFVASVRSSPLLWLLLTVGQRCLCRLLWSVHMARWYTPPFGTIHHIPINAPSSGDLVDTNVLLPLHRRTTCREFTPAITAFSAQLCWDERQQTASWHPEICTPALPSEWATAPHPTTQTLHHLSPRPPMCSQVDPKFVYYLSAEFLMGRSLLNAICNLEVKDSYAAAIKELGYDLEIAVDNERDAALGNGGLGRLAACFLDSMATLSLPGWGYGIRYRYGMFKQGLDSELKQMEMPDVWLTNGASSASLLALEMWLGQRRIRSLLSSARACSDVLSCVWPEGGCGCLCVV